MAKRSVNAFAERKSPRPKGPNPGNIPRSTRYVDPRTSAGTRAGSRPPQGQRTDVADEDERNAFAPRELPPSSRNRAVSHAALASSRARMSGDFSGFDAGPHEAFADEDMGVGDNISDEQSAPNVEGFSREDVEAIVNEALRRDRVDRAKTTAAQTEAPGQLLFRPSVAAAVAEPTHPADAFMPPQRQRAAVAASAGQNLPHGALSHPSGLLAMPLRIADVDRLWDWLRADGDQGVTFLGMPITTSPMLHEHLSFLAKDAEAQSVALIRALYWQGTHFGFAMLAPILADEATALMHIYLMKDARGSLHAILPALVALAQQAAPGKHLAVASLDKAWAKLHRQLLTPLGFVEHTMFVL